MDPFKKLNEEIQKFTEVIKYYKAGKVISFEYPNFEDKRNISYFAIYLLNFIGDYIEDLFLYASLEAKKHGNLDSILLLNNSEDKKCILTIKPELSSARYLNPNKNPLLEETETYFKSLIRGVEEYEKYQKQRWIKIKP